MNAEFNTLGSYFGLVHAKKGPKLLDFDANLFHKDVDFETATRRAQERGVSFFVVPGSTLTDSAQAIAAAEQYSFVVAATAGVHPCNTEATCFNAANIEALRSLVSSPHCSGVGECGLDLTEGFPPLLFQMEWLRAQIALAIVYDKPLYLHLRNSHHYFTELVEQETVTGLMRATGISRDCSSGDHLTLRNHIVQQGLRCVVHCFTGTPQELEYFIDLGCYIGMTGHIFSLPVEVARELLQMIPLCKLVIETDAPYMGFKGCRDGEDKAKSRKYPNVPSALPKIADFVAELLGVPCDVICEETTKNALSFFRCTMPI